jgi:hypothetical protein
MQGFRLKKMKKREDENRSVRSLALLLTGLLLAACTACAFGQLGDASQQRPRRVGNSSSASSGETIRVPARGDFQKALDRANPGDTIILEAGAFYVGSFTLPAKQSAGTDADYITIRTSAPDSDLTSAGQRITSAFAAKMPKLISPGNNQPVLMTAPYAHHYRFIAVEFAPQSASADVRNIITLGDGSEAQNKLEMIPHHLILDRCYIHAYPTQDVQRAVALNSAETSIINCYISEIHSKTYDAQAIWGWNGPGPFHIVNNHLESSGECLGFGGAVPGIKGLVPSDIEIRHNHLIKPVAWRGVWMVKQLLEFKCGQRVVVDANVMEYNWADAQAGFAVGLAVRTEMGNVPWNQTRDIKITNNIIRHAGGAFNILGKDDNYPSNQVTNILIANNLIEDINSEAWGGNGHFLQIANAADIRVDHNTIFHNGTITNAYWAATTGFVMTNNVMAHNAYGISGEGVGNTTIAAFFPGAIIKRNVIAGADASRYPRDNFYPEKLDDVGFVNRAAGDYRLASSSRYKGKGTDGKDVGCDFDALAAAVGPLPITSTDLK